MLVPPEVPLTRVQARFLRLQVIRRRLLPVLTRVRRVPTQPSPLQARRVLLPVLMRVRQVPTQPSPVQVRRVLLPVLMRVLLELRVQIPDSLGIRVRRVRFLSG